MKLNNSVIVITGASRGLGWALAEAFAQKQAHVVLCSRAKDIVDRAAKLNGLGIVADVTDEAALRQVAAAAIKRYGQIDIWINNAGTRIPHGPVEQIDINRMHQMMEVNVFGVLYGSRAALNYMKPRQQGTIVNILSTSALTGRANSAAYAASKYAATGFTKSLRLEVAPAGITVIGVYPGGMRTNFFDEQKPDDYDQYMPPADVARRIIANLEQEQPEEELIVKRPSA